MRKLLFTLLLMTLAVPLCFGSNRLDDPQYLKGYWRFNSNATDYSGHGNDCSWVGTEAYGTSPWGATVADMTDDTSHVRVANSSSIWGVTTGDFTVSVWAYSDYLFSWETILQNGVDNWNKDLWITNNNGVLYVKIQGSNVIDTGTLSANKWYFITINRSGSTVNGYINGVWVDSSTNTENIGDESGYLYWGDNSMGYIYYSGYLAEGRIYNIALTQDEILTLYHRHYPQFNPPTQPIDTLPDVADSTLVGSWLNKATQGAKDLSSNNNDGTPTAVTWMDVGGDFDGSSSKIDVGAITLNDKTTTWMVWFNGTLGSNDIVIGRDSSEDRIQIDTTGRIQAYMNNTQTYTATGVVVANAWNQAVMVYDGNLGSENIKIYVNGTKMAVTGGAQTGAFASNADSIGIGDNGNGATFFEGKLKDVRIYDEAKTADWIAKEYKRGIPSDDLVLHVTDGTKDLSRYAHTLTNSGAVVGDRMEFDGASSVVTIADNDTIDMTGITSRTWVAWIKPDSDGEDDTGRIIAKRNGYTIFVETQDGKSMDIRMIIDYNSQDISRETTDNPIITGAWNRVVAVWNEDGANKVKMYINGVLNTSGTDQAGSTAIADGTNNLGIGGKIDTSGVFDGEITDLRIYNTAKSADWIAKDYERTKIYY